jgi:hypothetical protein
MNDLLWSVESLTCNFINKDKTNDKNGNCCGFHKSNIDINAYLRNSIY